jgi:hypothetical protein
MESIYTGKIIISSVLLILLVVAGIYIHLTGKPYNTFVFTVHKLFTVAMIIILVITVKNYLGATDVSSLHYLLVGGAGLALTGLLISGGMMSLDKLQETMLVIHRICTGMFLVCYPIIAWFLLTNTTNKL